MGGIQIKSLCQCTDISFSAKSNMNPYKRSRAWANSADLEQTPQNAVSDQVLHCLLTECSIKIWIKMKNATKTQ